MKEYYVLQHDDFATVSQAPFILRHPNGKTVKLDTASADQGCDAIGSLRLNTGTEVTWMAVKPADIFKSAEGWCAIQDQVSKKYLRHCNGVLWESEYVAGDLDFAWIFYKQTDGTYQLFNPFGSNGNHLGYDEGTDKLHLDTIVNWILNTPAPATPLAPPPPAAPTAPVAPAASAAPAAPDYTLYIFGVIALLFCLLMLMMAMRM